MKADGWTTGSPFNVGWLADHVLFAPDKLATAGGMTLRLDNVKSSGKKYSSGSYRTREKASFGTVQARIKPPKGNGLVSSLFVYTGPAYGDPWDEIDIEFLGKDTTRIQVNYFTAGVGRHESTIYLGFDASLAYHDYGFSWQPDSITWYVDGVAVHQETGARGPLPSHPMLVFMNLWAGDSTVTSWLGRFAYTQPVHAYYDSVRYTAAASASR